MKEKREIEIVEKLLFIELDILYICFYLLIVNLWRIKYCFYVIWKEFEFWWVGYYISGYIRGFEFNYYIVFLGWGFLYIWYYRINDF